MTLHEKSLKTLEIPAILEMLSGEAVSEAAKEAARALSMSADSYAVRSRLEETTAAKNMSAVHGSPPFSGVRDIRASVRRADMGGALNTQELLSVAGVLRAAAAAISYSSGDGDVGTAIDYLFSALRANKFLENKISSAIVAEGEISDNASSELADIRRHMRQASDRVRQALNKVITSPTYSKALQEPIITQKNGRYVVPVKAEHKSAVPGLMHDISSSGATLFIEPMAVVQLNNEIRELMAKENIEIDRILLELSADVAAHGEDIISDFETLAKLDLIFAKAKLSYKMNAAEPELSEDAAILLRKARHPLLPVKEAVPIDIALGGEYNTLVITGPNTGGKTVALKTLGLLCAMAQCGLHIPVSDGSRVPVLRGILADIGDEQSIEQSLSTFSSHMTNIVEILKECGGGTLLLFDELGAGTDPVEGAALAISIIEYARGLGALCAATTHYAELKTYAVTQPGVVNASCEFNVETLKPTYRLITGVPGKSNAFAISQRLGLPEGIINDARSRVGEESAELEAVIGNLEQTRLTMERERAEANRLLQSAREDARRASTLHQALQRERENAAQIARREAEQILNDARRTADEVMEQLREIRREAAKETDWRRVNEEKAEIYRRLNEAERVSREALEEQEPPPSRDIVPGDRVRLKSLGTEADVIAISPDGVLSLQAGIMKITARPGEVRLIENANRVELIKPRVSTETQISRDTARPELDLRGMTTDEGISILERYLDGARMAKLETVTIIHGKGTGAMRDAVHQCLRRERGIKSFRLGRYGEGEAGVTVVEFK